MTSAANGNGHIHAIRLTIPAKPEYITLGRLALTGIARLRPEPLRQEVLGDLKLALTDRDVKRLHDTILEVEGEMDRGLGGRRAAFRGSALARSLIHI